LEHGWQLEWASHLSYRSELRGSTRLVNTNDNTGITVDGITFDSAAGAFVLNGNDITLAGTLVSVRMALG